MSAARALAQAALSVAREREPHGFVYVLRSDRAPFAKIGYTENVEARLKSQRRWSNGLIRSAPELRAVLVCEFETRDHAYTFEQRLLWLFESGFGTQGRPVDWFPLTDEHEEMIAFMASRKPGFVCSWGHIDRRALCRFCGGLFEPSKQGRFLCSAECRTGEREQRKSELARARA